MAGVSSGPTPWWQTTEGNGGKLQNLQNSAPPGYKYDPVQMSYVRTPVSTGQDLGAVFTGLANAGPPAISSSLDRPVATGTTGGGAFGTTGNPAGAFPTVNLGGGSSSSGSSSSGSSPSTAPGGGFGSTVPPIQAPDLTAANAAAFGSAKDQVGQETQGALRGLAGAMAGRGISGSGVEGRGQLGAVETGQQQLGETSRQLAINDAALKEQNALAGYQGNIAQRGQDIGAQEAQLGAGVTQRGQDIGFAENQGQLGLGYSDLALRQQQAALSALKGFNIGYGGSSGPNLYGGGTAY